MSNNNAWLAFTTHKTEIDLLNKLSDSGNFKFETKSGDISQAITDLKKDNSATKLLIDINSTPNPIEAINELANLCQENTIVIIVGDKNDVNFYKQISEIGIDDYLLHPLDHQKLTQAIEGVEKSNTNESTENNKHVIGVIPTRGGIGNTTIASNIGWLLSSKQDSTCLVDLDLYYGTSALMFDQNNNQGLSQALINAHRLDDVFLKRLTLPLNKNYFLLAAEHSLDQEFEIDPDAITHLFKLLANTFDFTVVDIPHSFNLNTSSLLMFFTHIYIVGELSISSLRDTSRLLEHLQNTCPYAKTKLIVINDTKNKDAEITQTQFEENVKKDIDHIVPFEKAKNLLALNSGKILSSYDKKNQYVNSILDIAKDISPSLVSESTSFWGKLIGR